MLTVKSMNQLSKAGLRPTTKEDRAALKQIIDDGKTFSIDMYHKAHDEEGNVIAEVCHKTNHGGEREGSGRKHSPVRPVRFLRAHEDEWVLIKAFANAVKKGKPLDGFPDSLPPADRPSRRPPQRLTAFDSEYEIIKPYADKLRDNNDAKNFTIRATPKQLEKIQEILKSE